MFSATRRMWEKWKSDFVYYKTTIIASAKCQIYGDRILMKAATVRELLILAWKTLFVVNSTLLRVSRGKMIRKKKAAGQVTLTLRRFRVNYLLSTDVDELKMNGKYQIMLIIYWYGWLYNRWTFNCAFSRMMRLNTWWFTHVCPVTCNNSMFQ